MEIFVFEFFTGGGLWLRPAGSTDSPIANLPLASLFREGAAMHQALLDDFGRLPRAHVTTLHDVRVESPQACVTSASVSDEESFWIELERACRRADYVLLVAPECHGWLLSLVRTAERLDARLLGPGSEFVQWASDKHATADVLNRHQAICTQGMRCRQIWESDAARDWEYPVVAKPFDGAGSAGIYRVHDRHQLQALVQSGEIRVDDRCEPLYPGQPGSVAILCGPGAACDLRPCWQHIAVDGTFRYSGGQIMRQDEMAVRAQRLIAPLQSLWQTTVGLIGVDFILGDDPNGRQDVIIEVNPRVTTSYIGLQRYYCGNLAQAMIDVAEGRAVDIDRQGIQTMQWLGLDIGGANIKVADGREFALTRTFPLWKDPSQLSSVLREVIAQSPPSDHLAVTMTGELADCFTTKTEGVLHILAAVEQASDGRHARVYTNEGRWLAFPAARRVPLDCAAANWHALARFVGRYLGPEDHGLLIDIGTTTTDLIPIGTDGPQTPAKTDLDRLRRGELLYSGVVRSPVCGVAHAVPFREQRLPVALERFATMRDVYTVLGELPEDPGDLDTADGRPATKVDARRRLGRMLCADESQFHHRDAVVLAQAVRQAQVASVGDSCRRAMGHVGEAPTCVVASGCGEFLAKRVIDDIGWSSRLVRLGRELGPWISVAATAHALAILASRGAGC